MTENERIREVRKHFALTMESFGNRVGLKKSAISLVESGRNSVSDQFRNSVCREFGVSEEWLKTGEGDMIAPVGDDASIFAFEHGLSSIEEALIREYLNLSEHDRSVFRKYLKRVILDITAADEELSIDEKVASYRAELEAEAASNKSEASQTGSEDIVDEA